MSSRSKITCLICGDEFVRNCNFSRHLKAKHNLSPQDYYNKFFGEPKYCPVCGKETPFVRMSYKEYCSFRCRKIAEGVDIEGEFYKRKHNCLICGQKDIERLKNHLKNEHSISLEQYYEKFYKRDGAGFCLTCGKPTRFDEVAIEYKPYCSSACASRSELHKERVKKNLHSDEVRSRIRATNLSRYGAETPFGSPQIQDKVQQTNINKHGCKSYLSSEEYKQVSLELYGTEYPVQSEQVKNKIRKTCREVYGVDHPAQSDQVKERIKATCLERYGHESPMQSEQVKERVRATCVERYGCESALSSPEVREKIHETVLAKYGVDYLMQNEQVKDKAKQTFLERYGCESPLSSPEVREKIKQTNLQRYGCEYASQNPGVKEKTHQTFLARFGTDNPMQSEQVKEKARQTNLERHGYEYAVQSEQVKEKTKQTCLERYGTEYAIQSDEVREKIQATNLEKYGCENPAQNPEVYEKIKRTNLERYGCENAFQSDSIKEKAKQTNLERYGYENPLSSPEIKEKIHQTSLDKYGTDLPIQAPEIREKINKTHLEKYGGHPMQNQEVLDKAKKTRTENKSWNISSAEDDIYSSLVGVFGKDDAIRQYKEERYNYKCDFYIKSRDLFIELNVYKSHMGHWYDESNPEDVTELERLENSDKGYDNMCAKSWLGDVKKREAARQNNLNYVVFWRKEDVPLWISLGCPDGKDYIKEYSWLPDRPTLNPFCDFPKELAPGTTICRAVAKAANGDILFRRECKMWEENPLHKGTFLQPWLYANRLKYMDGHKNPIEISDAELIRGFTISGTIRGYSRYDVKPMRELLTEYNVKSIYDPCAGWGERLALCGAMGISYEGVDINEEVVNGHNKIISHYNLSKNCSSTCGDSAKYTPKSSPDAIFTCPPYLAKEIYTDKGAENFAPEEFEKWWSEVCSNFPDSAQHVFVHIDEETKPYIIAATESNGWKLVDDRYFSKKNASHFNRGKGGEIKKKNWESVLIFSRENTAR